MMEPNVNNRSADEMDRWAARLAAALPPVAPPRAGFDQRVMDAVRASHARDRAADRAPTSASVDLPAARAHPGWWRRTRTISASPVAWGALAAGFAGVVSLATLGAAHLAQSRALRTAPPPQEVASGVALPAATAAAASRGRDTVYVVRFVLADAHAHSVTLVGDFNAWAKHATPLRLVQRPGVWTAQVALTPGRHEYAFVVDGKQWVPDPAAQRYSDDFGTQSSVVTIGSDGLSSSRDN